MPNSIEIRNPKRGRESRIGRASWYRYYAGFSPDFVEDALRYADPRPLGRILDPWNGSGTTTEIASSRGFEALGFDLNPVMAIVAKARLLNPKAEPNIGGLFNDLIAKAETMDYEHARDPLDLWLSRSTVAAFRKYERALQTVLMGSHRHNPLFALSSLSHVSSLASFFYVAAFRALRQLLNRFRSANPTWIVSPESAAERVVASQRRIFKLLREQVEYMIGSFGCSTANRAASIDRAGSCSLPVERESIDVVITSPPYCTRIDYVKKTAPELAFLGAESTAVLKPLRDQMIGTPTIGMKTLEPEPAWGKTCLRLLEGISGHQSYASKSYYWKTYIQYFHGIHTSLREINRTLKPKGKGILVVQDSYYKDTHVDLARIICEMASGLGWAEVGRFDFETSRTIVGLNKHATSNGNPKRATESVLAFAKNSSSVNPG